MRSQRDKRNKKSGKKSVIPSFLTKLYQILENSEYQQIVKWSDNGRAFIVKNLPEFIEQVLPSYFKHNNFASFVRQLNMYDFHKTRNSNNENTFYHKMFNKGQKNNLKLIKRKVNSNRKESIEDSEISEVDTEKEIKNFSNKNIMDTYSNLMKRLEEVSRRQKELEIQAISIERQNDKIVEENQKLSEEMVEKKSYTKNLEIVIYFIFELMMKKKGESREKKNSTAEKEKEKVSESELEYSNLTSLIMKYPEIDLTALNSNFEDNEKTTILKKLMESINENILQSVIADSLKKYNLKMEDINLTIAKNGMPQSTLTQFIQELSRKCSNCSEKKGDSNDTNHSTQPSLQSTQDQHHRKIHSLIQMKRKRTDESYNEWGSGNLNLNQKEKDTIFDEITGLTPHLIASPGMSPTRAKRSESLVLNVNSHIFSHKNSADNLYYNFSLEDNVLNMSNIVNVDDRTNQH